jgi:hypothetical protein
MLLTLLLAGVASTLLVRNDYSVCRQLDHIYMVMEYMDHDLKSLMEDKSKFSR